MLGVVLAVVASLAYGLSDVLSGAAVRRHSTASVALWSQLTGLALLGLAALVVRPALSWPVLGWGLAAGALAAVALLLFYTALQRGRTAVVAPVAGSGVVVPVVAGLLGGEPLAWPAALGVAAVVAGVLVVAAAGDGDGPDTSGSPEPADRPHRRLVRSSPAPAHPVPADDRCVPEPGTSSTRSSVVLAALAAAGFGGFFVLLDLATTSAGGSGSVGPTLAVALAVQAGAVAVTLLAAAGHTRACLAPRPALLLAAGAVGLVDVVGDLALVVAVGIGPLAVVGPLGSLDPVVTVLIAVAVLGERPRAVQVVGVAAVLAGVVLVATG
ncbi:EamA family transporter [Pseudonocardia kunmingensis]|uniref:EamA-like transporter family protein n=1 Tax=Pseudonocardia kunmingensis TaxID=630975 RepID=A0A543E123_9PSEU|nr:EamA family transporter [Pseudonocardia kunmingensis]TQM15291.1 EamA-like transporter family protein [Pseudonocardia kunmingensis]